MKPLLLFFFLVTVLSAGTINVAVASNVGYVIKELSKEFSKAHPDTKIQVILGSSGKLAAQTKHGAPYHIFMSANEQYPQDLYKGGFAIFEPKTYAKGSLVMLSSKPQDFTLGIKTTTKKNIKSIALASMTAPYGVATLQALKNASVYKNIKNKLVFSESISQTLSHTLIATDLGFVAKSALFSPSMSRFKENIHWITVDEKLYSPLNQSMVLLKKSSNNTEAKAFYDFILSKDSKAIFNKLGYISL